MKKKKEYHHPPIGMTLVVDLLWIGGVGVATGVDPKELLVLAWSVAVEAAVAAPAISLGASLMISAKLRWTATFKKIIHKFKIHFSN